jgi:putative membrane-bound dehydrogenase-like protein
MRGLLNALVVFMLLGNWKVAGEFQGASEPVKMAQSGPLAGEEERATFSLPPGFEIELVAHEAEGIGKFVTVDWDQQGRMWSMTALEYPVDANESPEVAKALYENISKDKIVYWEKPFGPGPHSAKVFAEGLAIPLGILPYKNGVYVQHGPNIEFLSDTDGDGKADKREIVLSGFGVQDSHLFPHQFTRAPGNWIWMAQGAFNYGKVRTSKGVEQQFDRTRMAKFRYDGSDFEITSQGPCNIWGLVLNSEGEAFIQEANDYGYPMMPFHEYANYPGCSDVLFKSYAPEFPGTAPHFQMGGTGLSGLAFSDRQGAWPAPYAGVFYIANPITRMIQAIQVEREGPRYTYKKLPDFIKSSDEMFRPVSIHFGPDGCLYIVDWYNKIISHNEVPRNHPERDKKRGRIWRVKHKEQKPFEVPDFTKLPEDQLLATLGGNSIAQSHLAWQAITDRELKGMAPALKQVIADSSAAAGKRIASLWALEGLHLTDAAILKPLLLESNRNIRREAIRAFVETKSSGSEIISALKPLTADPDPEVRSEIIKTASHFLADNPDAVTLCVGFGRESLAEPTMRSTHNGRTIKTGVAYEREFERYLVRYFLEQNPAAVAKFLGSPEAKGLPVEYRLVAALSLEPNQSAIEVAKLLQELTRDPNDEEILRLAQSADSPEVHEALQKLLDQQSKRGPILEAIFRVRSRLDPAKLSSVLEPPAKSLLSSPASADLGIRIVSAFKLQNLETNLVEMLKNSESDATAQLKLLRGLREMGAQESILYASYIKNSTNRSVRGEALNALVSSQEPNAAKVVFELWPELNFAQRRTGLEQLSGKKGGAVELVRAWKSGTIKKEEISRPALEKLKTVLAGDPDLTALLQEIEAGSLPALRLNGKDDAWLESNINLSGPFTVETWVKLDPGIDNNDGILGAPDVIDMNFYDSRFRVWVKGENDVIVATKPLVADSWTHIALTRDGSGILRIYLNGELDKTGDHPVTNNFEGLRIAWTAPSQGTKGWLSQYRVWNLTRSAQEIRADFDRSFEDEPKPQGLAYYFTGTHWPNLRTSASVEKTDDLPPLLTGAEAAAQAQKFSKFRELAMKEGNAEHGKTFFTSICLNCHSVAGQGAQIGPVLNGAGAMGTEALLRAILTPNAAMEAGYRTFRVETRDGEVVDGLLVSQDKEFIVLRRPNSEDLRIPQDNVRRADYLRRSMMPEGLIDSLSPTETSDLFAYLKTLK